MRFLLLLLLFSLIRPTLAAPDFNSEVRPILSQFCFKCHGMDEAARKAKLRFDVRESALQVITPGQPDNSEFIKRIFSHDEDELMPPPAAKRPMSDEQKNILRAWVQDGAKYEPHWAFVAPKLPKIPPVKDGGQIKNPIDNFIIERLGKEGLKLAPEADKYSLVRRVYLDLIGLSPTPEEADAFAKNSAPDAYEKLVDTLLSSPQYGERWARRWLDLARYADTNGYEKDRNRTIWPYRDWVIKALNDNMPFDQFTIKQLAGDMLPHATPDDKIATGFHRNTMLNEEGGIDPLEYRYLATVDRVATTGTTWLGLTTGCAQCHTHKFDPIEHTEYFQLMAFLNNADEPDFKIPDASWQTRLAANKEQLKKLWADLPNKWPLPSETRWQTPAAQTATQSGVPVEALPDGALKFGGAAPQTDVYTLTFDTKNAADRLKLEVLKEGEAGPGRTPHGNFVLSEIEISAAPLNAPGKNGTLKNEAIKIARAAADFSQANYAVANAIDDDAKTGWAIDKGGNAHDNRSAIFYFEKPIGFEVGTHWTVKLTQNYGAQHVIGKLRLSIGEVKTLNEKPLEDARREAMQARFAQWNREESAKAVAWKIVRPSALKSTKPYLDLQDDGSILAGGDSTKSEVYDLQFDEPLKQITAVRLEVLPDESLPGGGPGMTFYEGPKGDFFLSELQIVANGERLKVKRATQSFPQGDGAAKTQDGNMSSGWSINGAQGEANAAVFELEKPLDTANLNIKLLSERHFSAPIGHFRLSVTTSPNAEARGQKAKIETILAKAADSRNADEQAQIFQEFLETAPELSGAQEEIKRLRRQPPGQTTLVMQERPAAHPRPTFLHHRGEFLQPETAVVPGVPAFLPPLPKGAPLNRLTFAKWLVSQDNPLTARVVANRQWQAFFGRGLVRTVDDFGYQGEAPSHPELLDYLALQFQKNWDVKALHKFIVMSATYQQSSRATPELIEKDPQNILLARGPKFRLDAEIIRDSALKDSGLLSAKMGGPGVYPPQTEGVTEVAYGNMKWPISGGEDRYRRSVYTYMKRTAPFAMFNTFDGPSGESCLARREVSNTPLQALVLLNDVMFQEAAQALGRLAIAEKQEPEQRATFIFRRCLTRPPDKDELQKLLIFADKQRARGDDENAVWTAVSRAVMNLDESITKS